MEKNNNKKESVYNSNNYSDEHFKKIVEDIVQKDKSAHETSTKKGVNKHKKVVTSKRMVVDLHEKGLSQSRIASDLGVSQQYVSKVLRSLKFGDDRRERFHNFSLTFNAVFNFWEFPEIEYRTVAFGHTHYKNWDNGDFHIQIFINGRIMVRYNKDVIGLNIVDDETEAIRRILDFLQEWNKFNVRFVDYVISSGENEFMNSPLAQDLARKGQTIKYKDRVDGKNRSIIDFSPSKSNPSGAPHFEHVHKLHYNPDSQKWEEILDDVATGNYDPLHITKSKIEQIYDMLGKITGIQEESALQASRTESRIDERLEWMAKNNESHQRVLEKMEANLDKIASSKKVRSVLSRDDKVKLLRNRWW